MHSVGEIVAGKYRVVRRIAEGGMGVLFEAVHISLEERVAIKFVRAAELGRDAIARFEREARLAVKLRTEHVARVLDAGRDEAGDPFIVMEYLDGVDLGQVVRGSGRIDPALAADYLLQACHGLAEAHALTIVHRDVKPANLFLTEDAAGLPTIKVLDFGISKAVDGGGEELTSSPERAAQLLGTPHYVSPEQLMTPHEVDARADIWSLGVCGWALATGKLPFTQSDLIMLFAAILNNQAPSIASVRSDLPDTFVRAIDRCLRKDRKERFLDVGELAQALGPLATPRNRPLAEHTMLLLERGRTRAAGGPLRTSNPSLTSEVGPSAFRPGPESLAVPRPGPAAQAGVPAPASLVPQFTPGAGATGGAMVVTHTLPVMPAPASPGPSSPPPSMPPPPGRSVSTVVGAVVVAFAAAVVVLVGLRVFTPLLGHAGPSTTAQASALPLPALELPTAAAMPSPTVVTTALPPAPTTASPTAMPTVVPSALPAAPAAPPGAAPGAPISVPPKKVPTSRPHPTDPPTPRGVPTTRN